MVTTRSFAVLGLSLVIGLALFGLQIGRAVKKGREFDRFLTVRGLAEREVKADLAIWPIRFSEHSDDLAVLKTAMEKNRAKVVQYLRSQGIEQNEINLGLPIVRDREEMKANTTRESMARYVGTVTLVVRSRNIDIVRQAMQAADRLIEDGVPLTAGEYGDDRSQFLFTALNAVKPEMIKEATANARLSAEKFAQDSKSKVGAIRKATQGLVEIEDRDPASPERKLLRVVTTIEFFLE